MDKKFIAWLLITTSLFLLWYSLRSQFLPPPPPKPVALQPGTVDAGKDSKAVAEDAKVLDPSANASGDPETKPTNFLDPSRASWHVLGSLAPNAGYRQLVYLTNQGASIERIELIDQSKPGRFRYRSLEGLEGYMGHLGLREVADGLRIGCIPEGSPASAANSSEDSFKNGLQVGDVIQEIDHQPMVGLEDWYRYFAKAKRGHEALLQVKREVAGENVVGKLTVVLTEAPLDVVRVVDDAWYENVLGNVLRNSCLTTLSQIDSNKIMAGKESMQGLEQILKGYWNSAPLDVPGGMGVEFSISLDGWLKQAGIDARLDLVKRYRLNPVAEPNKPANRWNGYTIDMEVLVRNRGDKATQVALRQESFNGLTLEGWWYLTKIGRTMFGGTGARDIVYASNGKGHQLITRPTIFKEVAADPTDPSRLFLSQPQAKPLRELKYLGIDGAFFAAAVLPYETPTAVMEVSQAATMSLADSKMVGAKQQASNVTAWFDTPTVSIPAGQESSHRFLLFAGPKAPDLLAKYGLGSLLEYGWFGWVAIPLTYILHTFYSISSNFGIAVIMLTVLVRSMMFPISRKAAISAQKMQELGPELKKVNELYKDDLQARTKATQELYKKANFNPMAGCLPLFIQIPIFIGLYRAVSVDVELRQQALIPGIEWCSNLAGPDMLLAWSSWMPDFIAGKGTGWFGPYLNLLPIITISLFIIQQKILMPKATDEQQQATQTMMMYMTVFMGVLFFKVPAGLCIYFITSSIWSLVERRLIKKFVPQTPVTLAGTTVAVTGGGKPENKSTWSGQNSNQSSKSSKKEATKANRRPETLVEAFPWLEKFLGPDKKGPPEPPTSTKSRKKK